MQGIRREQRRVSGEYGRIFRPAAVSGTVSMETNKLTKDLLAEGYTKENPPDWVAPWNDFYGGWQYPIKMVWNMVFETPCGLLIKGAEFSPGHMSYMGVDWTVENDNYAVLCPKFDGKPCELNHELLRGHSNKGYYDTLTHCACRKTDKPYDYERSYEKAHADVWAESDRLFGEYDKHLHGRACRYRSHYSRTRKQWRMIYDPMECANSHIPCEFCKVLQTPISAKKGNVFYDIKKTWIEKGVGFLPDEEKASITKGVKLLPRPVSVTLCEAIIKYSKNNIIETYQSSRRFAERLTNPTVEYELYNFRCETRASRDLLQDLRDAAEGIEVIHSNITIKAAKEQKRERRKKASEARIRKIETIILKHGYDNVDELIRRRAGKLLDWERIDELEEMRRLKPTVEQLCLEELLM